MSASIQALAISKCLEKNKNNKNILLVLTYFELRDILN